MPSCTARVIRRPSRQSCKASFTRSPWRRTTMRSSWTDSATSTRATATGTVSVCTEAKRIERPSCARCSPGSSRSTCTPSIGSRSHWSPRQSLARRSRRYDDHTARSTTTSTRQRRRQRCLRGTHVPRWRATRVADSTSGPSSANILFNF